MHAPNIVLVAAMAASIGTPALAEDAHECDLQAGTVAIKDRLASTKIQEIRCAPIPGWFEVQAGQNLFYLDPEVRFLVVGGIYDLRQRKDVTAPRIAETGMEPGRPATSPRQQVDTENLPSGAIIYGEPGGQKVFVFSDPQCPYCRALHSALSRIEGIEVHEYLAPILRGSENIVRAVYCAQDRPTALASAYQGTIEISLTEKCGIEEAAAASAVMREHGFTGTPSIIRSDGIVQVGFPGEAEIRAWLKEGNAK